MYSTPILERWGVRRVSLVSDEPQASRALPMGQVILGSHGILADLTMVPNSGGEQSHFSLWQLVSASVAWALTSQVYNPSPGTVTHLPEVDMTYWYKVGFYCAQQAEVDDFRRSLKAQFTP